MSCAVMVCSLHIIVDIIAGDFPVFYAASRNTTSLVQRRKSWSGSSALAVNCRRTAPHRQAAAWQRTRRWTVRSGVRLYYSIVQLSYHVFRKITIVWKKCLTFAVGFGILLKLSLRDRRKTEKFGLEPIEVLKKNLKKFLTNASGFDILNKLLMSG